jgi:hypothetical protein
MKKSFLILAFALTFFSAMAQKNKPLKNATSVNSYPVAKSLNSYKSLPLKSDISTLSDAQKQTLRHLIEAAVVADEIFWLQSWGDKSELLNRASNDTVRNFITINYGPWDRLNNNAPFVAGVGEKPKGANFYPKDITVEEWRNWENPGKNNPYSIVQRDAKGNLVAIPYHVAYEEKLRVMVKHLSIAASIIQTEDERFAGFLQERCEALMQSDYNKSDISWLGLLNNRLDIIIGPIENYEDEFQGSKTAFESYVMIRDTAWTRKLEKYVSLLPALQQSLPVAAAYKPTLAENGNKKIPVIDNTSEVVAVVNPMNHEAKDKPGSSLAVFDVVFYAGHNNAGSKTIAVNLPNDETLQQEYGTRRSQLKNVMQAKFDNMVKPIASLMLVENQADKVNFDAFFNNVMFHEVAHGLGIKNTINGQGTVREALGADFSPIEECKADVLGLYMVTQLLEKGELAGKLEDFYITFVAGTFRSVRFGAASAHGKANMIIFNTLVSKGAISRQKGGKYSVKVPEMKKVISNLAAELLTLQGDGNKAGVANMLNTRAVISEVLKIDLTGIEKAGIPVDLIFEQGPDVLGLNN